MEDFKARLVAYAKTAVAKAPNCANEDATKIALVLPFVSFLGYDIQNPLEVCPEHGADFSDKYKNKVDYAIMSNGEPVVAIECKKVGALLKDDRGQLRSYFNAAPSAKMAILTDGIQYEFFADSESPNMMDANPFLVLSLTEVAVGKVEASVVSALYSLQRSQFDPANIGAEAKKKLVYNEFVRQIAEVLKDPPIEFVRMLLDGASITYVKKKTIEESYIPLARDAINEVINRELFYRVGVPRQVADRVSERIEAADAVPNEVLDSTKAKGSVVTTDRELALFNYIRHRLAFLVKDDKLFEEIEKVQWRDQMTKFTIFYVSRNKGRILDFVDDDSALWRLEFADGTSVVADNLKQIDSVLIKIFRQRVEEVVTSSTRGKKKEVEEA